MNESRPGRIIWVDLTVENADTIRDFYQQVIGWSSQSVDCGGYDDYNMVGADDEAVAGICHKRGVNASIPSQWMVYFTVENLEESLAECEKRGGRVVVPPRDMGEHGFAVIQDPAEAVCALIGPLASKTNETA